MKSLFIFRRDLRLYDNTTLGYADNDNNKIIPIFIFDPHQLENKNRSNNCVQFMIESLKDLDTQLRSYKSKLYTFYGNPWDIVKNFIQKEAIDTVYVNQDYTVYSKYRDKKIMNVCQNNGIKFVSFEDSMLNNIENIKTETGKYYEKFTSYYNKALQIKVNLPQKHIYKNLIKNYVCPIKTYNALDKLYINNPNLYIHGGRQNGIKILKDIHKFSKYNDTKNMPKYDTTLLSPHNKFGTVSIREVYHTIKNKLGNNNDLLRQLYWRDFYYNQMFFNENYYHLDNGKYAKIKWNNNMDHYRKWMNGETGIPIVDAGMKQLNKTGYIHNRIRMLAATVLTKILHIDWRLGEKYFQRKLIDYDVTQNIMNWYWISGEAAFSNPYFRVLNPIIQTKKCDKDCEYTNKWIEENKFNLCQNTADAIVDIPKMIKKSITMYSNK